MPNILNIHVIRPHKIISYLSLLASCAFFILTSRVFVVAIAIAITVKRLQVQFNDYHLIRNEIHPHAYALNRIIYVAS